MCAGADPGFGQGGPQVLRPKVAEVDLDLVKRSCTSGVSHLQLGSRVCLMGLEAFGFLMLIDLMCILPHSGDFLSIECVLSLG